MPAKDFSLQEGEVLLKESGDAVFLQPRLTLLGKPCRALLTDRRVIFREASCDLASMAESGEPGPVLREFPVSDLADVRADSESAEHSIRFDLRSGSGPSDRVLLVLRDKGWHMGAPERIGERDEWLQSLHQARKGLCLQLRAPQTPPRSQPARVAAPAIIPIPKAKLPPGELLGGKYELLMQIGEGGMGVVFRGMDRVLNRPVAVKKMRSELQVSNRDKDAFLREAQTSASLHHPFIVDIYEIIETEGDIYLVFEFVDGKTVAQLLEEALRLRPERVKKILRCVCQALAYAHSRKIAHRDLKPSNIILSDQGYAKVMDFGIARRVKDTTSKVSQLDTSGTKAYMAPEQELGRSTIRSDIFSLGATMYEMLTGELPFPGPGFYQQKEHMSFAPVRQLVPDIPEDLALAAERCLRFDTKERFQSAEEFARAIGVAEEAA